LPLIDERAFLLLVLSLQAERVLPGHRLQHADRAAVFSCRDCAARSLAPAQAAYTPTCERSQTSKIYRP
jgi:hypothetical protein